MYIIVELIFSQFFIVYANLETKRRKKVAIRFIFRIDRDGFVRVSYGQGTANRVPAVCVHDPAGTALLSPEENCKEVVV